MLPARLSSEQLAIGLLFVVIAALACLAPAQGDTWWLLRAGQDIWRTGEVPMVDTYSHTAAGRYWPNHEWLTEAVFYAAHRLGGMPALALVCAVSMTGAWALAYSLTRGPFEARLMLLIVCIAPAAGSFALRPQVFTMAAFALTCWLLVRNRLPWLPLVILIWANFHGAVALGLVAVGAVLAITAVAERRLPWALMVTLAACVVATALAPIGLGMWSNWLESPARSDVNELIEWQPPGLSPELWPFWGIAAALPVMAVIKRRHLDRDTIRLVAIAVGVLPLAFQAIRNVHVFLLAALPAATCVIASHRTTSHQPTGENETLNAWLFKAALSMAFVFVTLVWIRPPAMLGWEPISDEAVAAVAACDDPMFNTYGDGGVFIWFVPERRVFVDNRQDPYPADLLVASQAVELGGDYRPLFDRYGIQCAVLPSNAVMADGLEQDPDWRPAYRDHEWVVYRPAVAASR